MAVFVSGELPDVLDLADVVVSRYGAGTLAELTVLGKPAVFVLLEDLTEDFEHGGVHRQDGVAPGHHSQGDLLGAVAG